MQSENCGKLKIKDIKYKQEKAKICFDNDLIIDVSMDVCMNHLLYVGKELEKKEIEELKKENSFSNCYNKALKILSKGFYSIFEIESKLKKAHFLETEIQNTLQRLKNNKLLDDERYVQEFIDYAENKFWGKQRIITELKKKGINEKIINKGNFNVEKEKENLFKLGDKYLRQYQGKPINDKKEKVFNALVRNGFSFEESESFIQTIDSNSEDELIKMQRDYEKILNLLQKKHQGKELKSHIVGRLMRKGYNYEDIKVFMEDKENVD